jgi:UDP-GlcNAc:undecaprenyl-phosphate/decaprenyl-phosphate GlcNAc-1-phosphate transferase
MTLFPLFVVFASALFACLLLTPLVRSAALLLGLVDEPDGRRKIHARPIPIAGGVAVLLTTAVVLTGAIFVAGPWREALTERWLMVGGLAAAATVIAIVGVADDYYGMRGGTKLFWQLVAVAIVMSCGVHVGNVRLFGTNISLGVFAIPFTAFWLLGAINSLNLIDGMDGLLGCLGSIICGSLAAMAFMNQHYEVAVIATAMAGSLLGFLCFNFPPATIFLGDCGSMLIGLVVGVLAIESSLKGPATVALAAPAALLVIPILDTSAAIVRRKLTGRSIYTTDRGHLHHVLLRRGLSNRGVLLLVGGLCIVASAGAFLSLYSNSEAWALLTVLVVVGLLVVSRLFGHAEFLLIKERLLAVFFAIRHGSEQGRVHQSSVRLQGSVDWDDLWRHVTETAQQLRLQAVCLDVNAPALHEGYHARWGRVPGDAETSSIWRAEVPLAMQGQIVGRLEFAGQHEGEPVGEKIALAAKLAEDVELTLAGLTGFTAPFTLEVDPKAEPAKLEDAPAV